MSLLPAVWGKLRVNCKWLIVSLLIAITFTIFPSSALAQGAPNPQPCSFVDARDDGELVDNVITLPGGEAPIIKEFGPFTGKNGDIVELPSFTFDFEVDFSQLQALFASSTSRYLEGDSQSQSHTQANLLNLVGSGDFNSYFGPNQKLASKSVTDKLRENYVEYVYGNPHLLESANQYTDISGQGGTKTVYDLVNEYGLPQVPEGDQDRGQWNSNWGKYWAKIPTAYSESYKGELEFKYAIGEKNFLEVTKEGRCNFPFYKINFVMPEFFRAAHASEQLSQLLLPLNTQADPKHKILGLNNNNSASQNPISFAFNVCRKLFTEAASDLQKGLKSIIKISFNLLNPIKPVYAESKQLPCIKPISADKTGQAPYCPLPQEEYDRIKRTPGISVSCVNKQDNLKLTKEENVICTFNITWPGPTPVGTLVPRDFTIRKGSPDCVELREDDKGNQLYSCRPIVRIWPNFKLPWSARIWNNTTISSAKGSGVFGFFTPNSIKGLNPLPKVDEAGKTENQSKPTDLKLDLVRGVKCNRNFARDLALKPEAVQDILGINSACE